MAPSRTEQTELYDSEFMTAVVAGLALKGIRTFRRRQGSNYFFDHGMQAAFASLKELRPDLDCRFQIILHYLYQDSSVVAEMIAAGLQRALYSLDTDGLYRLYMTADDAPHYLRSTPFTEDEAQQLAQFIIDA